MASPQTCSECGAALPSGSPGGYCPKCMLGLALGETGEEGKESSLAAQMARGAPPSGGKEEASESFHDEVPGYKLLQPIGHGGCGVVYMAEQQKPVHRRVALKVIKIGMDTRQVVARFEAEKQALARMEHPNIARVLDAGATSRGRPYFAMELVGGLKITDYCDQHKLTTRERLELFIQICRAIQHAHQKGIIHRDIKPSNVLVAEHDGTVIPKVIDFGIAKATQGKLVDETFFTAFEQFLGTPVYMSPEQAQPGGLDVDTRSDIYSLGVLLYELLTGRPPFELQATSALGVEGIRRTVLEKEPPKPSTRLHSMEAEQLEKVAGARQVDPPRLVRLMRGDLDWIVMKCLEKDRARRYETANGLAMDIQRHLNQEPVLARPPSALYQLRKFVSRNRVTTLSAVSISLALILGTAASTWQALKATKAEREQSRLRKEAQAARKEATEELWALRLAEARALRSGEAGSSFDSLDAIRKAAAIRPSLELRNEAIASLAHADIRWVKEKKLPSRSISVNLQTHNYASCDTNGMVSIRRLADDHELAILPVTNSPALGVWRFSPNGELLLVPYADKNLRGWDWQGGLCVLEVPGATTADFSPNGKQLAIVCAGAITVFDLPQEKSGRVSQGKRFSLADTPQLPRFDPRGKLLALYDGNHTNVDILELASGRCVTRLRHDGEIFDVGWSPDARYLATTCDAENIVHVWDTVTGQEFKRIPTRQGVDVSFNPEGDLILSSGWDGRTRLWDFPNCTPLANVYKSGVIAAFEPDGRGLVECHWNGRGLDFFEIASPRGMRTLYVHENDRRPPSGNIVFSHNGRVLAFHTSEGVRLLDISRNQVIGNGDNQEAIGFDSADQHLVATDLRGLLLWPLNNSIQSLAKPEVERVRVKAKNVGMAGCLSGDGEHCFLIGDNRCQIFDTQTFSKTVVTGIHPGMRYIAANRDGSLVATGAWLSPNVIVWDGRTGEQVKLIPMRTTTTVAFSPDGRHLVTGSAERYVFWQTGSWAQALSIPQPPDNDFVPTMAFSPDGRIFAGTHSRRIVRLHNATTGEVLADLEPPDPHMVTSLSFNEDGKRLAVSEGFEAIRVWDLQVIHSYLAPMGLDWTIPTDSLAGAAR